MGRNKDWSKKPESRIGVPYELAHKPGQKKALAEIWSILEAAGLDLIHVASILKSNGVQLIVPSRICSRNISRSYPVYSTAIGAGFEITSQADAEAGGYEEISLDALLVKDSERTIILKVTGNSMRDDGIYPGSILVVETTNSTSKSWLKPETGNTVVASIVGADSTTYLTVKRIQITDEAIFLIPRNRSKKELKPIQVTNSDIIGIVRSVSRVLR